MSNRLRVLASGLIILSAAIGRAGEAAPAAIRAKDGFRIFGDYFAPERSGSLAPICILVHAEGRERSDWSPLIAPLHRAGFAILAIDLRGHGESATSESAERARAGDGSIFDEMYDDVRGAYDWLADQPDVDRARFALVGAGVGCNVALRYAAKDRSVDAIVCMSPRSDALGVDASQELRQIEGRRILFLAAEADRGTSEGLARLAEGTKVSVLSGASRGAELLTSHTSAVGETVDFLIAGVGAPSTSVVYGSIEKNLFHAPDSEWVQRIADSNLRVYSSPAEAKARGLQAARSKTVSQDRDGPRRRGR